MEASRAISSEDRQALVDFLQRLRSLLEQLVFRRPALWSPAVAELLEAAWRELEREGRFDDAVDGVQSKDHDSSLTRHGLYGDQLRLKAEMFKRGQARVKRDEKRLIRFFKQRRRVIGWALKTGNVLLGSLADAIPGGAAIKELKEATEAALEDEVSLPHRIRASFGRRRQELAKPQAPDAPLSA